MYGPRGGSDAAPLSDSEDQDRIHVPDDIISAAEMELSGQVASPVFQSRPVCAN